MDRERNRALVFVGGEPSVLAVAGDQMIQAWSEAGDLSNVLGHPPESLYGLCIVEVGGLEKSDALWSSESVTWRKVAETSLQSLIDE